MREQDALAVLRGFVAEHGSQYKAAQALHISQSYLGEVLNRKKPISEKILDGLGLTRETTIKVKRSA